MKFDLSWLFVLTLGCTPPFAEAADENVSASAEATSVDQCASAVGFVDYRQRLERAVARRDRAALRALVSADIRTDSAGELAGRHSPKLGTWTTPSKVRCGRNWRR
jgi:hypothetical protein